MKQYLIKAVGTMGMLALISSSSIAQDDKKETTTTRKSEDVIVITPKAAADTKLTIEIKGDDIKINGKPMAEYKSDDVNITRRKHLQLEVQNRGLGEIDAMGAPRSRFKGGTTVYGYGNADMAQMSATNNNKAFLGVGTEKAAEGVRITSLSDKSAAEKAGLKEGDIITKINETSISSPDQLTKTIGKFNPADKITLTYKRDNKEQQTSATLDKRKPAGSIAFAPFEDNIRNFNFDKNYNFSWNNKPKLGLKAQETEEGKGLAVLGVDDESAAEKAGIKEGDIITSFDGTDVNDIDKLRELSKPAMEKGSFKVKFIRDGKSQEVSVKIPKNLKTTSL